MRAALSIGALVANKLLCQVAAQGSYGDRDGSSRNGNPDDEGDSQQSTVTITASGESPSGALDGQSCLIQDVTTVFITLHPTSPVSSDAELPVETASSDVSNHLTVHATRTISVSPLDSAKNQPTAQAFTTLTISDLFSKDSGNQVQPGSSTSDSNSSPTTADSASTDDSSAPNYGSISRVSTASPTKTDAPDGNGNSDPGDKQNLPSNVPYNTGTNGELPAQPSNDRASKWYTVVTDSNVEWVTNSNGPSPVTIISEHTITLPAVGSEGQGGRKTAMTCWTVTGADGKETVVESPISTAMGDGSSPMSSDSHVNVDGTLVPQIVTTDYGVQTPVTTITLPVSTATYSCPGMTTSTSITVLVSDGVATVVYSTWVIQSAPITNANTLPTDAPLSSGMSQGSPDGNDITSCTSYTIIGSDGRLTVVESTLVLPESAVLVTDLPQNLPNGISGPLTPAPASQTVGSGSPMLPSAVTSCTSYTVLGPDGQLTVVESSFLVPGPNATPAATAVMSGLNAGVPAQDTVVPISTSSDGHTPQAATTCISYTIVGADGRPTVVEAPITETSTNILLGGSSLDLPSMAPQGTVTSADAAQVYVTSTTVIILGPDGIATPFVETIVVSPQTPAQQYNTMTVSSIALPSFVPQGSSDFAQGVTSVESVIGPVSTVVTVTTMGPNGVLSPVVQTIVVPPQSQSQVRTSGIAFPQTASGIDVSNVASLKDYGGGISPVQIMSNPSPVTSGADVLPAGVDTAPRTTIFTIVNGPNGVPILSVPTNVPPPSYIDAGMSNDKPAIASGALPQSTFGGYGWFPADTSPIFYGPRSSPLASEQGPAAAMLQTSTWTNVIPEPTTTYTMKFPLTTLTTITVPAKASISKRALRRQNGPFVSGANWSNSSTVSLQPPQLATGSQSMLPVPSVTTSYSSLPVSSSIAGSPAVCATGDKVGNMTITFETLKPGPLFNPAADLWFSEGFLIAPPSPQFDQGYMPSSGGQLVQFVPPALSGPQFTEGSGDTAEIGVGPNSAKPCFRFNLYKANLGCAAQASEQWCEFEISAYTYNQGAANEMSLAVSEVKRVPACPNFPNGPCTLTAVAFDGYQNITSVLVKLRVGLDLRTWWGDDFQVGWTDNACEAVEARDDAIPHRVKRQVVESAIQRGVWKWTPTGLERLEDEYLWDSLI